MELEAGDRPAGPGRLTMAAITHVFTITRVAQFLGEDEDSLREITIEMEPEDGVINIYGHGDNVTGRSRPPYRAGGAEVSSRR